MKCVLLSVRPRWVVKILNGDKTIEVRKRFPIDYVGWVYVYCTKGKTTFEKTLARYHDAKVVARFWCDKVENLYEYQIDGYGSDYEIASDTLKQEELLKECCLTYEQLNDYLGDINNGKAIHITKLEIFDEPKEINEFYKVGYGECVEPQGSLREQVIENYNNALKYQLTRAPQSFMFIEV